MEEDAPNQNEVERVYLSVLSLLFFTPDNTYYLSLFSLNTLQKTKDERRMNVSHRRKYGGDMEEVLR